VQIITLIKEMVSGIIEICSFEFVIGYHFPEKVNIVVVKKK